MINHKYHEPELVHVGLVLVGHTQNNEERLCRFFEDVTSMKGLIVFYICNGSFFLTQLQCNKLLKVKSPPQCIFKTNGMHHLKKICCKPGWTWIQKQHFLYLENLGLIIEERM